MAIHSLCHGTGGCNSSGCKIVVIGISGKIGSGKDTVANIIRGLTMNGDLSYEELEEVAKGEIYSKVDEFWQIKKFADKLKDIVCLLIGCTREQLEDRQFKESPMGEEWRRWSFYLGKDELFSIFNTREEAVKSGYYLEHGFQLIEEILTPRKLLQVLGTDCGRDLIHPNIWVNALFADYNKIDGKYPNWLITDVRFPNEAKSIRDQNGILIRINRLNPNDVCQSCNVKRSEHHYRHPFITNNKKEHRSETSLDDWDDWDLVINNDEDLKSLIKIVTKEIYENFELDRKTRTL